MYIFTCIYMCMFIYICACSDQAQPFEKRALFVWDKRTMTDSTENTTPPKSTKSRNSNPAVPIQIKPKSQFEFVSRDTEESESLELVDFGV